MSDVNTLSSDAWSRMHDLRLKGPHAAPDDAATAEVIAAGYALMKGTYLAPTPDGRAAHEAWARIPAGTEAEETAKTAYEKFLALDMQLKTLVHAWQTTAKQSGPMGPEEWDLIDKLKAIDGKAGPMLRRLSEAVDRFSSYRPRLSNAVHQLEEEGDRKYFCGLLVDSYHTAWWQLHEDLLVGVGIARADDPNQ